MNSNDGFMIAQQAVMDALSNPELLAKWGPRKCEHGDWADCESRCDWESTQPANNVMLQEFTLVGICTDMETGASMYCRVYAPNQLDHHTKGMLHKALYEWD